MNLNLAAKKIVQGDTVVYAAFPKVKDIAELLKVPHVDQSKGFSVDADYQRMLDEPRANRIKNDILSGKPIDGNILVSFRDKPGAKFVDGNLLMKSKKENWLWVVDGQHRYIGIVRAMEVDPSIGEWELPMHIMLPDTKVDETRAFLRINDLQKKTKKDHTDSMIACVNSGLDLEDIPLKEQKTTVLMTVAATLNKKSGVFANQIDMFRTAKSPQPIKASTIQQSLKSVYARLEGLSGFPEDISGRVHAIVSLVENIWAAMKKANPTAMSGSGCLKMGQGIWTIHRLLADIVTRKETVAISADIFAAEIAKYPLLSDPNFWGTNQVKGMKIAADLDTAHTYEKVYQQVCKSRA